MENFGKVVIFPDRPDWGNAAWADMAGLGSIFINDNIFLPSSNNLYFIWNV